MADKRVPQFKDCATCGKPFRCKPSDKVKRCSRECHNAWQREHRNPPTTCKRCGKEFRRKPSLSQVYCSNKCREVWTTITCPVCGTQIQKRGTDARKQRYCSATCRGAAARKPACTETERECVKCGEVKPITNFRPMRKETGLRLTSCRKCSGNNRSVTIAHIVQLMSQIDYTTTPQRMGTAKAMGIVGFFTPREWRDLCAKFGNRCACCRQDAPLTIDHIVPVSRGGSSYIDNIQPLCLPCNRRKATRTFRYAPTSEAIY